METFLEYLLIYFKWDFNGLPLSMQVDSMFEYLTQNPIFGVVNPDSVFYAPVLGFFALIGLPTPVSW